MTKDFTTLGASYTYQLFQIPQFSDLEQFIEQKDFVQQLPAFLQTVIADSTIEMEEASFDTYYAAFVKEKMEQFEKNSFLYKYLGFIHDFQIIKNLYLQYRAENKENYFSSLKEQKSNALLLFDNYAMELEKKEMYLHTLEDTSEFIASLDSIFLLYIGTLAKKENQYIQKLVSAKIETYNIMSLLRLTQLGRSQEHVEKMLLEIPGFYSLGTIRTLFFGDIVSEVGKILSLPTEHISVTSIETVLLQKEIRAANQAMFFGVGEERIIQYFEKLRFFLSNIKLAIAVNSLHIDKEKMHARMINYDLI